MGLTKQQLIDTITSRLGGSQRRLELKPTDFDSCIAAALKVLARYFPQHGFVVIPVSVYQQKYVVPAANCLGVLDVTFFNNGGRFTYYPYPDASVDHALIMGQMKEQEKTYGDLPEWDAMSETDPDDSDKEKVYVYVHFDSDSFLDRAGRIPTHISVKYAWHIEPSDDKKVGLPRIRYDWQEWVENYAIAEAKRTLGKARDKFKGIPGPDGNPLPVDGADLIREGDQERAELVADIKLRQRQMPLIID